ncbi:hypothetical protein K466DRAFT_491697, partial [Polyporus arcularius HHB13444]
FHRRLVPILNFKDLKTSRFAVGTIPLSVTWGTLKQGADMDRYIVHGTSRLTAWFIGLVTTVWLTPREGSRINIGLQLLSKRDHDTARQLQYDLSPVSDLSTAGQTVFCSRFLSTRAEDGGCFEEVYDAQDRLLPWGQMPQITADRIQKTDLVLAECAIKRFRSKSRTSFRKGWHEWAVNFDLIRVALLSAGPGAAGDLVPDDCDVDL